MNVEYAVCCDCGENRPKRGETAGTRRALCGQCILSKVKPENRKALKEYILNRDKKES